MLKQVRLYVEDKPVHGWALLVAANLALCTAPFLLYSGPKNIGITNFCFCLAFVPPTLALLVRCSDERRLVKPVAPSQEAILGLISAIAFGVSFAAEGSLLMHKRMGFPITSNVKTALLIAFALSALISIALGYAGRYSKLGRLSMALSTSWISLIVVTGFVLIALDWPR